ncbi:dipeptidase PepE [Edwardsiella tarda]|uniref:Dipeptidase PepE n=2 Tax=Edwardsiella tarda TaxID=636 RepID=A0A2A7TXZ9_EDWTA|nr:dipeptidase PepE [Edwardsiella tarda]AKH90360.1 dipeptidase PepE [Edwardsiella tarda]ATI64063.1 dipeptidase PepE [Edwardsiella tarda]PEH71032.1 dipeptidase PepE [Edwardsiella tarda]UAL56895.1 dipeptidase PepE [Edwardsiella tarda]UCQ00048.1 dipeptidase PepE [Edwardsiella tarda ATCC 15947 = NBRC 105688]
MELFLLSNGKVSGESELLGYAKGMIQSMLLEKKIRRALLIPYALIRSGYDARAAELEHSLGIKVESIHHHADPVKALEEAECILVSGGNTWVLNQMLHENGLVVPIQRAVREREIPYIGWSAGCNVATPSIRTTNDMPVRNSVVLPSLGLFPVQINPHYIDAHLSGHMGETRDERIAEFCAVNPSESVIALREGSLLHVSGETLQYYSAKAQGYKVFRHGEEAREYHDTQALASLVPFHCR